MPGSLVLTKLALPLLPVDTVQRPRLLDILQAGRGRRFTLLVGPPGSGKTVLLCQWQAHNPDLPFGWLSLDRGDNDPMHFWAYVVAALQRLQPKVAEDALEALLASRGGAMDEFLALLINDIADLDTDALLVLEDFHVITDAGIHQAMSYLLERLPPRLHLVISARADPPLPSHRLRVRGALTEIRQDDLRFTVDEVETFVASSGGLGLEPEDVAVLAGRTEGWAAGLKLAAMSLQSCKDPPAFVRDFAGTDRAVADYLLHEIINRQSPQVREFMLATSVLSRFCAPLCDALLGRRDSQRTLEQLERTNLFLVGLDERRGWYRYHHLFAELLRHQLHTRDPEWEHQLHWRAGAWHEERGDVSLAVEHYLRAEEPEQAFALMVRHAGDYFEAGRGVTVRDWFRALPQGFFQGRPEHMLGHAWGLMLGGQPEEAAEWLRRAEREMAAGGGQDLEADVATAWSYYFQLMGDPGAMVARAREALEVSAARQSDERLQLACALWLVRASAWLDDLPAARRAHAASPAGILGAVRIEQVGLPAALSWVAYQEGHLREAVDLIADVEARAEAESLPNHVGRIDVALTQGAVHREQRRFDLAERALGLADALAIRDGQVIIAVLVRLELARLRFAQHRHDEALVILHEARRPWPRRPAPVVPASWIDALEARFRLASQDHRRASALVAGLGTGWEPTLLAARVDLVAGAPEHARRRLEALWSESSPQPRRRIQVELLATLVALAERDRAAERHLKSALEVAEAEGFVQVLVDEGPAIMRLLWRISSLDRTSYARSVLRAAGDEGRVSGPTSGPGWRRDAPAVEALSERELTVLAFLPSRLTNTEIAGELYVSPNTLKTHLKRIYRKLGVTSRSEAVARAERMQLL